MDKKKICFAASSGGHFEQLLMLKQLINHYESIVVTEKTEFDAGYVKEKTYYLHHINRKQILMPLWMIINTFVSIWIMIKERPAAVITTGVLAVIPLCLLCKLFGGKLIYIESFAKVTSPTKTGKFIYRFANRFYVQWESMKEFYPNAIYLGGLY